MFWPRPDDAIRSRVTLDEISGLQIDIPPARSVGLMFVLSIWLIGWAVGEILVAGSLLFGGGPFAGPMPNPAHFPIPAFLFFWLVIWTLVGATVIDALAWQLRGREEIRIDPEGLNLVIRRIGTFFPRRTRTFALNGVRNLRWGPPQMLSYPWSVRNNLAMQTHWLGIGGGSVAFDVDGRTERFGSNLSEVETRRLVRTIKDHYKISDDADEALPVERL